MPAALHYIHGTLVWRISSGYVTKSAGSRGATLTSCAPARRRNSETAGCSLAARHAHWTINFPAIGGCIKQA